jgi:hypothetical protein
MGGQEISVRGNWTIGDTGQELTPERPCAVHTVRDGWIWVDGIFLLPRDKAAKQLSIQYHQLLKPYRREPITPVRVVATIVGRLETRNHFEVERLPGGKRRPRTPFQYFVAMLTYRSVSALSVIPYTPEELKLELEWRRQPWAKPVEGWHK